ncbi:G-protein coupled receptor fragment [Clonorchis sinensis]|uniref:G-protein coupled receptor n=1 Tax=Clonorchis sinensis TaxID=79923 RepID=G7YJZ2_CLOSI|nr:G-protein coupled receptor fragment [Clonorchis sinensis]
MVKLQVNFRARRTVQQSPDQQPINLPELPIFRHISNMRDQRGPQGIDVDLRMLRLTLKNNHSVTLIYRIFTWVIQFFEAHIRYYDTLMFQIQDRLICLRLKMRSLLINHFIVLFPQLPLIFLLLRFKKALRFFLVLFRDTWSREAQLTFDLVLIFTIYLIPLFVVCVSQHVITVHLKQSQRLLVLMGHQNTVAWTRRRQRLTRLCVLMAALFVLSWTPNHIANLLIGAFKLNNEAMEIFLDFSMLIALSNAVTGPLLLIATCSVYHRYLRHLFACHGICPGTRPGLQTTTVSIRSSLSILSQAVNLAALPGREEHNPQHLEVAPHVIHSVASDFDNTNIE